MIALGEVANTGANTRFAPTKEVVQCPNVMHSGLVLRRNEFEGQRLLRRLRLLATTEGEVIASAAKQSHQGLASLLLKINAMNY